MRYNCAQPGAKWPEPASRRAILRTAISVRRAVLVAILVATFAAGCSTATTYADQLSEFADWVDFAWTSTTAPTIGEDADWVVTVDGDDEASGKVDAPFATLQRAVDAAGPGDVIVVRGGTYRLRTPLRIRESGTADDPVQLSAWPGERPVLDGSDVSERAGLVSLSASYWIISDLEIRNGPYAGVLLEQAHHNRLERLDVHHNGWTGVHLDADTSYNVIVDTRSHDNFDAASGGAHADGFAAKPRTSRRNAFLGCEAFNNSDDGFDLLESDPQWIDRSVAYRNGLTSDGGPYPDGDGTGFKLGIGRSERWRAGGGHLVTRSVAWGNAYTGFTSNGGTRPILLLNNTAFENGKYNFFVQDAEHVVRNSLSVGAVDEIGNRTVAESNSWQLGIDDPLFSSKDPASQDFLRLSEQSPAIGAGAAVPFAHEGMNPDLGAYEYSWGSSGP